MGEQKINVKSTYVATVKKDVADRSLSFYANEKKDDIFSGVSVFPEPTPEPQVNVEVPIEVNSPVLEPLKTENPIPSAPVETPVVSAEVPPIAPEIVPQESQATPLEGLPNLNILNPTSEAVGPAPVEAVNQPSPEQIVNPTPIPNVPPVVPEPIPNPVPEPVAPTPVTDTFANVESMVNEVSQKTDEAPIMFDASHETNLLGALSDDISQPSIGSVNVTPENLNVVREFGVDEPVVTDQNGQSDGKPIAGFVNSKILLILVIVFFLASCVFLGYEIYKYVTLPK